MQKIKKIILNLILIILFKKKVYCYPFVQSCVKLQLIIMVNGKYLLVKEGSRVKIPSVEVDLLKNHSIVFTVKKYLKTKISKKINSNNYFNLYLIDFCRDMLKNKKESRLFVDDLYIKIELSDDLLAEDLEKNVVLASVEEIKLLHFKNKFNVFDYKVIIKSVNEKGVDIK